MPRRPPLTQLIPGLAALLAACASSGQAPPPEPQPGPPPNVSAPLERTTGSAGRLLVYSAITGHIPVADQTGAGLSESQREAARAASLEAEIQEELEKQGSPGGAAEKGRSEPAAGTPSQDDLARRANPRIAPEAPSERAIPAEVFTESHETIPAGTWSNDEPLEVTKRTLDVDEDGSPEEVRFLDPGSGRMIRKEEDTDYDGRIDRWNSYEGGELAARVIDSDGDGQPDTWETYAGGRMTGRTVDRDRDGKPDAYYRYAGDVLAEEQYDSNADGKVDLVIFYKDLHRVRAEQDSDQDGRTDTWTTYQVVDGEDHLARVEKDSQGRGKPDTFETFEVKDGSSVLARREEDRDGDGTIDVISIYEGGKLVRREITNPDMAPL